MPDRSLSLRIHPSEFPAAIREAVVKGLKQGRIPGRLLYQSPAQARRWLAYHKAYAPSQTDAGLRDLYRQAFTAAAAAVGRKAAVAVSLGCGGGQKDGDLFDLLALAPHTGSRYVPVDTSPALVVEAMLHVTARHPKVATYPLVANLDAEPDLHRWLDGVVPKELCRLFCAFGVLPNLDPDTLLAYLRRQLRREDLLLLSANLSPEGLAADGERILAQYDNRRARAWYVGALESVGIRRSWIDLRIDAEALQPDGEWWQVTVQGIPRRKKELQVHGQAITLTPEKPLSIFHSHRFTPAALRKRLQRAKLHAVSAWEGAAGEEGIYLCRGGA